jgi:hypothetical protein
VQSTIGFRRAAIVIARRGRDILHPLGGSGSLGRRTRRLVGPERKIRIAPDILQLFNVTNCPQASMEATTSKSYKTVVVARR